MIKIDVIGNLGSDATLNEVNGRNVINMSVAHTTKWKDNQGVGREKTIWISAAYWSDKTNVLQYLRKGSQVFLSGEPDVKMYTNGRGETVPQITLRVHNIQLLGTPNTENNSERRLATEGNHYSQQPYSNPNRQNTAQGTISNDTENF